MLFWKVYVYFLILGLFLFCFYIFCLSEYLLYCLFVSFLFVSFTLSRGTAKKYSHSGKRST